MAELTGSQIAALHETASRVGIPDSEWLLRLIDFESGWDPRAKNPYSSARGLIQFIDSTARGLGYTSSLDLVQKNPTVEMQLKGPVTDHLRQYGPYDSEYKLYMAVFFPAARRYPPDTTFQKIHEDIGIAHRYPAFEKANPGIKTPRDYMNFVKKKLGMPVFAWGIGTLLLLTAAGFLLYTRRN